MEGGEEEENGDGELPPIDVMVRTFEFSERIR